jgi:acyl carrier protein
MDEEQVYARLTEIFKDVFDKHAIKITPGTSARDIDSWDSLAQIRLALTIEKAFEIKFTTSEIGNLGNVSYIVKLIRARTKD